MPGLVSLSIRVFRIYVSVVTLCTSVTAAEPGFPAVRAGVWELHAERVLPDGNSQNWARKAEYCQTPKLLFQSYWGLGSVERAVCRFESTESASSQYRIISECMIRGVGRVESDARITLIGDTAFRLAVDVLEGIQHYHATESGKRIGDCKP